MELSIFHESIDKLIIYELMQWELVLEAYTNEAEWSEAEFVPSFHEYIATASISVSGPTLILICVLFTGELLTDHILSQIDYRSKFAYLIGLIGRLLNDTKTYQAVYSIFYNPSFLLKQQHF